LNVVVVVVVLVVVVHHVSDDVDLTRLMMTFSEVICEVVIDAIFHYFDDGVLL